MAGNSLFIPCFLCMGRGESAYLGLASGLVRSGILLLQNNYRDKSSRTEADTLNGPKFYANWTLKSLGYHQIQPDIEPLRDKLSKLGTSIRHFWLR
jgi:hypothetical protein